MTDTRQAPMSALTTDEQELINGCWAWCAVNPGKTAEVTEALLKIIERLSAETGGWRPISEAPKDGTPVDLFGKHEILGPHRVINARFIPHDLYGGPLCEQMWVWQNMKDSDSHKFEPTHFRFPPQPPGAKP